MQQSPKRGLGRRASANANANANAGAFETLEWRRLLSTTVPAYLIPSAPGVEITPLLTTGDSAANGYRMAGIPDGLGAFDNGDGTFTVLMNHELRSTAGITRAHGSKGAFVSKWVIDKATGAVLGGQDQIKTVFLYDAATQSYVNAAAAFNRFCSATLAEPTAFYNAASGLGTQERIFTNGEENTDGRAFAHVVSTGESYQLPRLGRLAYENVAASPFPQDKTVVGMQDDSGRLFASEGAGANGAEAPSEVYFYVGTKQSTGTPVDRAGLTNGKLYGLSVAGSATEATVSSGDRFTLEKVNPSTDGDVSALSPDAFEAASQAAGATQFRRPEDGSWDPTNPNVYYFVTTDVFGGDTRLWKLTFDDVTRPEAGGKIEIAVDSPASKPGEMFDNVTVNAQSGDVLMQEDVGNNVYLGQVLQYDASTGDVFAVAKHHARFFLDTDPGTSGVQPAADADPYMPGKQGTQDEESSGIIDVSSILGPNHYLTVVQAHYANSDPELVEGGQLLIINTDAASATLGVDGKLSVQGTVNDDAISVSRRGQELAVTYDGRSLGTFDAKRVSSIVIDGGAGDDVIGVADDIHSLAALLGGLGNDTLTAGGASSILIGGAGSDHLSGGAQEDLLVGGTTTADVSGALETWSGSGNYAARVSALRGSFNASTVIDDGQADVIAGRGSKDWFFQSAGDTLSDREASELVNWERL